MSSLCSFCPLSPQDQDRWGRAGYGRGNGSGEEARQGQSFPTASASRYFRGCRWGERGRGTEFQLFCGQGPKNNPSGVTGHDQEPQSTQALVEEHTELGSRTRDLGSQEEQPFRPQ